MGNRKYTEEERVFIREYAYGHSYVEIVDEFNKRFKPEITKAQIRAYLKNHGISTGRTGRFEKGHEPKNKGVKGVCAKGCEKTWFKKGGTPANHKEVGTESIRGCRNKKEKYIYVKVAEPNVWKMKHILEWEKHYGKIPKGHVIVFLNGDSLNTDISNLRIVSRSVNARMNNNHLRFSEAELTEVGINIAKVIAKAAERRKEK